RSVPHGALGTRQRDGAYRVLRLLAWVEAAPDYQGLVQERPRRGHGEDAAALQGSRHGEPVAVAAELCRTQAVARHRGQGRSERAAVPSGDEYQEAAARQPEGPAGHRLRVRLRQGDPAELHWLDQSQGPGAGARAGLEPAGPRLRPQRDESEAIAGGS